jgi:hypothetical protein
MLARTNVPVLGYPFPYVYEGVLKVLKIWVGRIGVMMPAMDEYEENSVVVQRGVSDTF